MATYLELRDLFTDGDLLNRLDVALMIEAQTLIDLPTPTSQQQQWAAAVLANPRGEAQKALRYLLAVNSGQDVATIQGATDTTLQGQVNGAVDALVVAHTS